VAFGAGAIVGASLVIVRGCRPGDAIPFGPLLALGAATELFFGDHLTAAWFAIAAL
jgi:prepilin signal peptidase PulO-like enzyme (type II secretory pathway)